MCDLYAWSGFSDNLYVDYLTCRYDLTMLCPIVDEVKQMPESTTTGKMKRVICFVDLRCIGQHRRLPDRAVSISVPAIWILGCLL